MIDPRVDPSLCQIRILCPQQTLEHRRIIVSRHRVIRIAKPVEIAQDGKAGRTTKTEHDSTVEFSIDSRSNAEKQGLLL
jgi:hypothetical protein